MPPAPRRVEKEVFVYDLDEIIQKMDMGICEKITLNVRRTGYRDQTKVKITIEEVLE